MDVVWYKKGTLSDINEGVPFFACFKRFNRLLTFLCIIEYGLQKYRLERIKTAI